MRARLSRTQNARKNSPWEGLHATCKRCFLPRQKVCVTETEREREKERERSEVPPRTSNNARIDSEGERE